MKTMIIGLSLVLTCTMLAGCVDITGGSPAAESTPAVSQPASPAMPEPENVPSTPTPAQPFSYSDPLSPSETNYLEMCKKRGEC